MEVAFERPDYAYEIRGPALPFFHNTFPSSITGIPGHPVENVILENIEIIYPGKGNNGLANMPVSRLEDVPERESYYLEQIAGPTGVDMMKKIKLSIEAPDYRPAMVFDDVSQLNINTLNIQGETKVGQIVLSNTSRFNIEEGHALIIK